MARSPKRPIDWQLKNLDTGEELNPPYPVEEEGVSITIGGTIAEQSRFGAQDPITQWTTGKVRVIAFESVLFAQDTQDNITAEFEKFTSLAVKDESLGRPPICIFNFGAFLSEMVLVEDASVTIPPVRPEDGTPRRVTLSFNLRRYKPFSQTQIDPTKPTKESYFLVVTGAERSYEAIARRFYGDPLKGDRLRKRNKGEPLQPTVGAQISIPARAVILREVVEPEFHALSLTDQESVDNFERILALRNARKRVLF